ncbi:MAG: carboxypeptidase M32 [Acidobacteriota bacterium]
MTAETSPLSRRSRLAAAWAPVRQLQSVTNLLHWDQETYLPGSGQDSRTQQLSVMAGLLHEQITGHALRDIVSEILDDDGVSPDLEIHAAFADREISRTLKVPKELAQRVASRAPAATAAWMRAREEADFSLFESSLSEILELKREVARALGGSSLYDALLDEYEPGAKADELDPLFAALERDVSDLMAEVLAAEPIDENAARGDFPEDAQRRLGLWAAETIGFSTEYGRLDSSAHPFCCGMHPHDVRITWRADREDFRPGLFGILHEAGHAMYEQGLPAEDIDLPACEAVSLGVHESQSRLWENQVGRSRGFLHGIESQFQTTFGVETTAQQLWPVLNAIRPSLIRVEADEISYLLHIAIRYRLEKALMEDDLQVGDLEAAWNDAYATALQQSPSNATEGVLQDIHWASGLFGYFPTYALGTVLAAQLFEAAQKALGDLEADFAALRFEPLLDWLRENVHRHAATRSPSELIRRATGSELDAGPLLSAARKRVRELYG